MPDLGTPLPCRRPELVSRPFGQNGSYLVRDRQRGDSFRLGAEEYFLLAGLDGTRAGEDLRAAFAERFSELLTDEELQDFLNLAQERGFLQEQKPGDKERNGQGDDKAAVAGSLLHPVPQWETDAPAKSRVSARPQTRWQRLAAGFLGTAVRGLNRLGGLLSAAAGKLQEVKLMRFDYVPRPDDVFIVTYPRSGTTWMQMILYQLTTDGRMDFPHIYEYCPWFESSSRSAGGFEGRPSPRLFKSHLPYRQIPKGPWSEKGDSPPKIKGTVPFFVGPKYIYVARNGKDVAVSYYHLYRSHNGYQGSFAEFFDQFLRGEVEAGSWFQHVRGWWRHRHDPNVLFLRYEDLLADLEGCLRRIVAFCGLDIAPQRLPTILERCGFAFMKRHESQFDHLTGTLWEQGLQLNAFLRNGRVGDSSGQLSPEQEKRFARDFQKQLGPTGIDFSAHGCTPA
jgi:hypothetical protein